MSDIRVVFYCEKEGTAPALEWIAAQTAKVQDKCRVRIEQLEKQGHKLRRPAADFLRDGIYELRMRHGRVQYRLLYFFHSNVAAVLAHGLVKEKKVPPAEINKAVVRKKRFEANPEPHTYSED